MRKVRAFWMRLSAMLSARRFEDDFSAELESHLQMHIEDNLRSGMTPEQARREALVKLGGFEQTRQACRERKGLPCLETLGQDLRFALRMMRKHSGFTAVSVLTLALGIGANTAIFSAIKAVLMAPLPYTDASRIVAVWTTSCERRSTPGKHPRRFRGVEAKRHIRGSGSVG
jgi:hypothetical protein